MLTTIWRHWGIGTSAGIKTRRFGSVSLMLGLALLTLVGISGFAGTAQAQTSVGPGIATDTPTNDFEDVWPQDGTLGPTTNPNGNGHDSGSYASLTGAPSFIQTSTKPITGVDDTLKGYIDQVTTDNQNIASYTDQYPGIGLDHDPHNGCDDYTGCEPQAGDYGNVDDYNAAHAAWQTRQNHLNDYNNLLDDTKSHINTLNTYYKQHPIDPNNTGATCAQQLDPISYGLGVAGFGTDLAGSILESITSPAAEFGVEVASNIIESVGIGLNLGGIIVDGVANGLPNCEGVFTGTLQTYANVVSKMGVNAFDGAINLGYTSDDGKTNSYYDGITLGGGALAGAGFGGDPAETGDKDAIAIGNGAYAKNANDTAIGTGTQATGGNSTAIGAHANASGEYSTALGADSKAEGDHSVAIGQSTAGGTNGIAIGYNNNSGTGVNNTAIGTGITIVDGSYNTILGDPITIDGNANGVLGNGDTITGNENTVLGNRNTVADLSGGDGDNNKVLGNDNTITGDGNFVVGNSNNVFDTGNSVLGAGATVHGANNFVGGQNVTVGASDAIGIGTNARVYGDSNIGIGDHVFSAGTNVTAMGADAFGAGTNVTTVGEKSQAQGLKVAALGSEAVAAGTGMTALGDGANAFNPNDFLGGTNITAVGQNALGYANNGTAVGQGSRVFQNAPNGTAIGQDAEVFAANTTATGQASRAIGSSSTAYGQNAVAQGVGSTAVGQNSYAAGTGATAVGQNAAALYDNSAAFGYGAVATGQNQQVFGTDTNRYTMPGITTVNSTIHQVGPKSLVTTDGNGNLAADQGLYDQIGENQQGVAMAMALGSFWVPESKKFAAAFNTATFDGVWAMGANVGGELYDGMYVSGGVSVSQTGIVAGRAGVTMAW